MAAHRRDSGDKPLPGEVYFEWVQVGAYLKLTAIDADTGTEVSVMGPAIGDKSALQRTALAKLKAQLVKRRS